MVICDFYILRTIFCPSEHDPPLVVDAYRVFSRKITVQDFKTIARWRRIAL